MNLLEIRKILKTKTVGIAGCGGLGSNCAIALARAGIGKLIIADFDIIEKSNLNRQYYFIDQIGESKSLALKNNILKTNQNIEVIKHNVFIDENNFYQIFINCDIIIEAFDNTESKEMIVKAMHKFFPDKKLIMGIGMSGYGKNNIIKQNIYDNIIICGDQISETSYNMPPIAPRVGIVANMQANAVLEILLK